MSRSDKRAEIDCESAEDRNREKAKDIARSRTSTVLRSLEEQHKALVIQFLHESALVELDSPVLKLTGADLRRARYDDNTIWPAGFTPLPEMIKEP